MYNLPKITVLELYQQTDVMFNKYMALEDIILVNDNRFMQYKAKPLGQLEYGQVGRLKKIITNITIDGVFEMFNIIYGVKRAAYNGADVVSYFYALKWIKQEITKLLEKEKKVLTSEPNFELELAGVKRLNMFGELGTLINLGRTFGMPPQDIERWTYNLVFSIMAYDKTSDEIKKRYSEVIKKK